jgi:broad specificity phosphatase PhoE
MRRIEEVFLHGVEGVTEVWLVRHGDCYTDLKEVGDPPLSDLGRRQSALMAERVRKAGISAVYASDSIRAVQTAEVIGMPVTQDGRLREIQNDPAAAVQVVLNKNLTYSESAAQVQERMMAAVEEIAARHRGERVAVVSHGVAILLYACAVMRLEFSEMRLLPYYTSVTVVRVHPDRTMVGSLVDSTHLVGLDQGNPAGDC